MSLRKRRGGKLVLVLKRRKEKGSKWCETEEVYLRDSLSSQIAATFGHITKTMGDVIGSLRAFSLRTHQQIPLIGWRDRGPRVR